MPLFNGDIIFLDASGQIIARSGDLTLRADDTGTRSVIIGSGAALRPEKDVATDLGRPDLRWHDVHAGHIRALSGFLGDPGIGAEMTFDGNGFEVNGGTFAFFTGNVDLFNSQLGLDATSSLISNGTVDLLGTFRIRTDAQALDGDAVHNIGSASSRFGRIHGSSGIFNSLAAPSSGTFIGVQSADLLPLADANRALGSLLNRWARIHAASGIFNTIGAAVSGTRIECAASFVPNRTNLYGLGSFSQRWANVNAASGTFSNVITDGLLTTTLEASNIVATVDIITGDLTVQRNIFLDVDGDGLTVTQSGPVTWDLGGFSLDFSNGTPSFGDIQVTGGVIGNSATFSSSVAVTGNLSTRNIVPQSDRLYAIGTAAARYSRIHAASGIFNQLAASSSGTFIQVNASLVPERNDDYSLGTNALKWGNLFATSGTVTNLSSSAIITTDLTTLGTVNVLGNMGVAGLAAFNGGTFFGNAAAPSSDVAYPLGLQGFRFRQFYAASGYIETINPLPSGGLLTINGSVFPDLDLVRGLGGSLRRWSTVEAGSGIFTTAATIKGAPVVTNKDARTTVHAVITANSGIIISNTNEVDIYNYTVPGNTLSPSGKLQLECIGSLTNMSAAAVNMTPRVYVNGTQIWGDVFSVSAGPRAADFGLYADICALGSLTGQRVRGSVELATRTAGSVAGNGDFGALNGGQGNWSSAAASGTTNFANPVLVRVSMQLGTSSPLISYSGFQCVLTHTPFPGI